MNKKLNTFKKMIKNKKVAVLGIGISNIPLIQYLKALGADITAFDKSEEKNLCQALKRLEGLDIKLSLGENYLSTLKGFDVIYRTPGMRFDLPEILEEKERGAHITSEMETFLDLCPAKIIGVTGSDGKTTTTTLIYTMLKEQGYCSWLGGNIGTPLLEKIDEISDTDMVVLELSSFQLHTMKKSPDVAVITNISPNHLDVHKSMEEYIDAKKNIFRFQNRESRLVLNYDCDITRDLAKESKGQVVFFSRINQITEGALVDTGMLTYCEDEREQRIVHAEEITIPGTHNVENYLAAIAAVIDYVSPDTIKKVATSFMGVAHRIELVREIGGVRFYNDSIASSPNRTIAGLNSFNQKVILIAGGKDKKIPYDALGLPMVEKVKTLLLIGDTATKIEEALQEQIKKTGRGENIEVIHCKTYEEVVNTAYKTAVPGDIVLLSPASTSFDMFKNFEDRGNTFKEWVNKLS